MGTLLDQIDVRKCHFSLTEAIVNTIAYFTRHHASNNLVLNYDESTKELIIRCNNLNQNNFNLNRMTSDFEHSLWTILNKNISIQFVTPNILYEITEKNPLIEEEDLGIDISQSNINEIDQNYKLILKPIEKDLIHLIKLNFVGLQKWENILHTKFGDLLVAKNGETKNYVYINGIKIKYCNDLIDKIPEWNFTYCYNFKSGTDNNLTNELISYFFVDHFFPKLVHPFAFEKYIALILDNINDDIKENVYLNILNNTKSFEWDISQVKKLIVNFFTKSNPNKYLITTKNNQSSIQFKLAKENDKEIIVLPPNIFAELKDKKFLTVNEWAKIYYLENLNKPFDTSKLDSIELTNWNQLQQFAQAFVKSNPILKDHLATINCETIPLVIIDKLPVDYVWLKRINQVWINRSIVNNLTYLLSALFHVTWTLMPPKTVYDDFIRAWTNLLIKFCNRHAFDNKTEQNTAEVNKNQSNQEAKDQKVDFYFSDEKSEIKLKTKVNDNVKKNVIKGKLKNKNLISKNSKSKVSKNVNKTIKDKSKKLTPKLVTSTLIKAKIRNNPTSKITFTTNNDLVPIKQKYYLKDINDWKFPNTLPIYYRIDNEGWDVKSWKDILQITLMHLYQHHYHDKVLNYLKQKDIYLGKYKRTLISPRCIPNTDCWFAIKQQPSLTYAKIYFTILKNLWIKCISLSNNLIQILLQISNIFLINYSSLNSLCFYISKIICSKIKRIKN